MKTYKTFIIALLLIISTAVFSQSGVITWQSTTIKNLRNGEVSPYVCLFRIYPNNRIDWIQGSEELTSSFQIISVEGILPDEGIGQAIYHITQEGYNGTITIKRIETNDIILTLDLSAISSMSAYYQFIVISN